MLSSKSLLRLAYKCVEVVPSGGDCSARNPHGCVPGRLNLFGNAYIRFDYTLCNYSRGAKERGEPISGCRSCLLRRSCDGRIETPDGALVLVPDPRTCQYETGLTVTIRQHPLIRTLFATLEEAEKNLPGVMIPEILREQARSEMVEALRLNLIKLPEGSVDEEALSEIAKPFADEILRKHTPFHWQMDLCNWDW